MALPASPLGWHLVLRLQDDRVLAPSVATRRRLARVLTALAQDFPLLVWRVVDTHLHVLGLLTEAEVAELVRRVRIAVAYVHPGVPLLLGRRIPVQNQWHLAEAFAYVLRQDAHHGVGNDPLQEGSAVLDLLGMRLLGAPIAARVREHLPRVRREQLIPHLGVATLDEGVHLEHLADAAGAAFALPHLRGRADEVVIARRAAVHAAADARTADLARALAITPRSIQRLRAQAPPPAHVRAVALQMALRAAVKPSGALDSPEPPTALPAPTSPRRPRPRGRLPRPAP